MKKPLYTQPYVWKEAGILPGRIAVHPDELGLSQEDYEEIERGGFVCARNSKTGEFNYFNNRTLLEKAV